MEINITPEKAQLYTSQHLEDAIISLELAQEYTITSQIGTQDSLGMSSLRARLIEMLAICKSDEGLTHFKMIDELFNGIQYLNPRV